jgi:hypothetical protein
MHDQGARTDEEYRSLLQVLEAADGVCADPVLRYELMQTGFVRRDATRRVVLHLTPEGRRFMSQPGHRTSANLTPQRHHA